MHITYNEWILELFLQWQNFFKPEKVLVNLIKKIFKPRKVPVYLSSKFDGHDSLVKKWTSLSVIWPQLVAHSGSMEKQRVKSNLLISMEVNTWPIKTKTFASGTFFYYYQCVKERHSFERHSQNREQRRSATPFYQKERCGSGTHIFEESENMSGPLLSLFFF